MRRSSRSEFNSSTVSLSFATELSSLIVCLPDTPYGVDPFTFVSTVVEDAKAAKQAAAVPDGAFAIPAIPDHVLDGSRPVPTSTSSPPTADDPAKPRGGPKPKSTFPEALVPTLLAKIRELSTGSFVLIVEAVYQDLKAQKVKKNSLEAKIREVSEKTGSPKVWTVKPDVLVRRLRLAVNIPGSLSEVGTLYMIGGSCSLSWSS
jgi:chromatin assembly factor 1 subunit A